jgi:glycosyltransferase involved in cell wall biosynthesis
MKIVLISHYAGSEKHGMAFRPFYLAKEWVNLGHEVVICAASYSHLRQIQPKMTKFIESEFIAGVEYRWYKTPTYSGNGVKRMINIFFFLFRLFLDRKNIIKNSHIMPNIIISSSTYPMDGFIAKYFAIKSKAIYVHEVHDLWPLSPIEIGGFSKWHPFILFTQFSEDFVCKHADKIISILPKTKNYLVSRGMKEEKFFHIPNGFDNKAWLGKFDENLPNKIEIKVQELKKKSTLILGYVGFFGLQNSLDTLLSAAKKLKNKNIAFILVGDGHEKRRLEKRIVDEDISNVNLYDTIKKNKIPTLLKKFDIAYMGSPKRSLYRFGVSPNKLIEYMKAGLPILWAVDASNNPVNDANCGVEVEPENTNSLYNAILSLIELSKEERERLGKAGLAFADKKFSYKQLAKNFLESIL